MRVLLPKDYPDSLPMPEPPTARPAVDLAPAHAGRATPDQLRREVEAVRESPLLAFLLTSLQGLVAILNE